MQIFEEIYKTYQTDIFRFLMRLTGGDSQLAEELTQETFYQAFLAFGKFRGECQMRTWLCQIAKNLYAKHIRNMIRQRKFTEHEPLPASGMEDDLDAREQLSCLKEAVAKLDEPARSVVQYRLYSEMSYAEIAKLLKIRENTAMVLFSRAKAKIRKMLKEEYGYEI